MDYFDSMIRNSEEPEWLENHVYGGLRAWHIIFITCGAVTTIVIIVCCCIRFRIPRTKQQIEADYKRRQITYKFKQRLEKIQDTKIDSLSLNEALHLLYMDEMETKASKKKSPPSPGLISRITHHQISEQKPEPQVSFVKVATKVANISKLAPKSSASPDSDIRKF